MIFCYFAGKLVLKFLMSLSTKYMTALQVVIYTEYKTLIYLML